MPDELLELASRAILLSGNTFSGGLLASWNSSTLQELWLDSNQLTGELPVMASRDAMLLLDWLSVAGNALAGTVPQGYWLAGNDTAPHHMRARPGNERLCGEKMHRGDVGLLLVRAACPDAALLTATLLFSPSCRRPHSTRQCSNLPSRLVRRAWQGDCASAGALGRSELTGLLLACRCWGVDPVSARQQARASPSSRHAPTHPAPCRSPRLLKCGRVVR